MVDQHVQVEQPRYAQIPEALLYDPSISANAIRIYGCLARHGTDPSNCYPSHERIANLLGMSKRSVARPLAELVAKGWVTKEKRPPLADGTRRPDAYFVWLSPRTDARSSAQSSAEPARNPARNQRAESRDEGEQDEGEPKNEWEDGALFPSEPRPSRAKPRTPPPDEIEITEAMRTWARERGMPPRDLGGQTERFLDYHRAKGSLMADWSAAWRTWINNEMRWRREREEKERGNDPSHMRIV